MNNIKFENRFIFVAMEKREHIEIKFEGLVNGQKLTPFDVDISEIKDVISDIETFLYPTKSEKSDRPIISYKIEEGSARHEFFLPITGVILFNGLIGEVSNRKTIDFLDFKRAETIEKFQKKAKEKNLEITFSSSLSDSKILKINKDTNYFNITPNWINTEMTLYGEVYEEGGMTPNFHILTKEYGKLTVSATKQQILEGEKRIYKIYGLRVEGKQNLETKKPYDLILKEFIDYNPTFDKNKLDLLIAKATPKWAEVRDIDEWLVQIRGGENG